MQRLQPLNKRFVSLCRRTSAQLPFACEVNVRNKLNNAVFQHIGNTFQRCLVVGIEYPRRKRAHIEFYSLSVLSNCFRFLAAFALTAENFFRFLTVLCFYNLSCALKNPLQYFFFLNGKKFRARFLDLVVKNFHSVKSFNRFRLVRLASELLFFV